MKTKLKDDYYRNYEHIFSKFKFQLFVQVIIFSLEKIQNEININFLNSFI